MLYALSCHAYLSNFLSTVSLQSVHNFEMHFVYGESHKPGSILKELSARDLRSFEIRFES